MFLVPWRQGTRQFNAICSSWSCFFLLRVFPMLFNSPLRITPFHALNFKRISCSSPHLLGMVLWWLCLDLLAVVRPRCWRPAVQCLLLSSLIDLLVTISHLFLYLLESAMSLRLFLAVHHVGTQPQCSSMERQHGREDLSSVWRGGQ